MLRNPSPRLVFPALALCMAMTSLSGCKSEVDDKTKAKVEAAAKTPEAETPGAEAGEADAGAEAAGTRFELDAGASKVGFIGAKVTGDHKGSFETIRGSATVDGGELTALSLTVEVDSVKTDADPDLRNHLLAADFFEAETYPESKFTLVSVESKPGEGGTSHEVAGNLELHGQTNKITFPATVLVTDSGVTAKAEFSINRKQWGIEYDGKKDNVIKDDVALSLDLEFK